MSPNRLQNAHCFTRSGFARDGKVDSSDGIRINERCIRVLRESRCSFHEAAQRIDASYPVLAKDADIGVAQSIEKEQAQYRNYTLFAHLVHRGAVQEPAVLDTMVAIVPGKIPQHLGKTPQFI